MPGSSTTQLVYRKILRKAPADYKATTPRRWQSHGLSERRDADVWPTSSRPQGPEPADAPRAPLDYAHYEDKQVRAVVEPVLTLLGLDFDEIVGSRRQLRLF